MKKIAIFALCLLVYTTTVFAGDWAFVLSDFESHEELLWNFIPLIAEVGANYTGLQLLEGNKTELYLLGGGGFGHTALWTDADGMPLAVTPDQYVDIDEVDMRSYNRWQATWRVRLQQYLTPSLTLPMGDLAVFGEYAGFWMTPRENGSASTGLQGSMAAYPDQNGVVSHGIIVGAMLADLEKDASPVGFESELKLRMAPDFLGNEMVGRTNYYVLTGSVIGYVPVYTTEQENGLNLFSVYLADRLLADAVWGDAVPQREQEPLSLGSKMRGFEENAFGTQYTLVNNLELRFAGPEIYLKNLYPRVHLFLDAGVFGGSYLNTTYAGSGFLMSTGFEASATLLNIVSVGYRGAVVLVGENMEGSTYVGSLMASLAF